MPPFNKIGNGWETSRFGFLWVDDPTRWMKEVSVHAPNVVATIPKFYVDPCVVVDLHVDKSMKSIN